jgi:cyclin-dependent kinase-like
MNKYHVLGVVGEGTYGVVLKCESKDTNDIVAIKRFKESVKNESFRKVTLREVSILKAMRHENVVHLIEAFRRKGTLYLVFEFVEKCMLDVLTANPDGVDTETARVLTYQLANALDYCHHQDVLHRDIKPENLLIDPVDNCLKLCDFGFARRAGDTEPLTDYVATRWYRAPELLVGSPNYGKGVDVWSLGCIMGELAEGKPLFAGESEADQLFVIQKVLGRLTTVHMNLFLRNPRFSGVLFPDVSQPETLDQRYNHRMSFSQVQVLKGALAMDPRQRLTARDIIQLQWFEGVALPRSLQTCKPVMPKPRSRSPVVANPTSEFGHLHERADSSPAGEVSPLGVPWKLGEFFPERARACEEETTCVPPCEDPCLAQDVASPARTEKPSRLSQEVMAFEAGPHALGKTLIIFGRQVGDREQRNAGDTDACGPDDLRDNGLLKGERRRRSSRRRTVDGTRGSLHGVVGRPAGHQHNGHVEDSLPSILAYRGEHASHAWANPGPSTPRDKSSLHLPLRPLQTNPLRTPRLEGVPELRSSAMGALSHRGGLKMASRGR